MAAGRHKNVALSPETLLENPAEFVASGQEPSFATQLRKTLNTIPAYAIESQNGFNTESILCVPGQSRSIIRQQDIEWARIPLCGIHEFLHGISPCQGGRISRRRHLRT